MTSHKHLFCLILLTAPLHTTFASGSPVVSPEVVHQLALELSNEREVPDDLAVAIEADLRAIYNAHPGLAELPAGVPWTDSLLVRIDPQYPEEEVIQYILDGWPELSFSRVIGIPIRTLYHSFSVNSRYHPAHIASEIREHQGIGVLSVAVQHQGHSFLIPGDVLIDNFSNVRIDFSNVFIDVETSEYVFSYAWGFCQGGCSPNLVYRLIVSNQGDVQLVSRKGTMPSQFTLVRNIPGDPRVIRLPAGSPFELGGFAFPIATLQWYHNDNPTADPGAAYQRESITAADAGMYYIQITDTISSDVQSSSPFELIVMDAEYQWSQRDTFIQNSPASGFFDTLSEHPAYERYRSNYTYPWIELIEHGWWYEVWPKAETYFFDSEIGWFWTRADFFPYIYAVAEGKWYAYRDMHIKQNRLFYNINDQQWKWIHKSEGPPEFEDRLNIGWY